MPRIEARLREMSIELPAPGPPTASHMSFSRSGSIVYVSGQPSQGAEIGIKGVVGDDVDLDTAITAARLCAINLIAAIKAGCEGDLDRVDRILKIVGFVQGGPNFFDHELVIDACSSLIVDVFEDRGRHARSTVGVYRLPMNYCVEVDAVVQIL
jgi:enamine deaminase RidA (YjgF/YER057c/UK114 family)